MEKTLKTTTIEQYFLKYIDDLKQNKNFIDKIATGKYTRSGIFNFSSEYILTTLLIITEILIDVKDFSELTKENDIDRKAFYQILFTESQVVRFYDVLLETKIDLQKKKDEKKELTQHAIDILENTEFGAIEKHLEWLKDMNLSRFYGILWELGEIEIRGNPFARKYFHERQIKSVKALIDCINGKYPDVEKGKGQEPYYWIWYAFQNN